MDNTAENIFGIIDQASAGAINVEKINWARYNTVSFRNMEVWLAKSDGKALVMMAIPLPSPKSTDKDNVQMFYVIVEDMHEPIDNTVFEILSAAQIKEYYGLELQGNSKIHIANNLKENLINNLNEIRKFQPLEQIANQPEQVNLLNMAFTKLVVHSLDDKNLNNFAPLS